jgi:hypothetical protein
MLQPECQGSSFHLPHEEDEEGHLLPWDFFVRLLHLLESKHNHGKLSFALQQHKVLLDPNNNQVRVFGEIGLLKREGGDNVTLKV